MTDAQNTAREALISVSATALSEFLEWSSCARDRMDHDGKQKWRDAKVSLAAALSAAQAPTAAPGASWTDTLSALTALADAFERQIEGEGYDPGVDDCPVLDRARKAIATLNAAPPADAVERVARLLARDTWKDNVGIDALDAQVDSCWRAHAKFAREILETAIPPPQISEPVEAVRAERLEATLRYIAEYAKDADVASYAAEALAALSRGEGAEPCRSCGSTKTLEQMRAEGFVSCCPERSVNDLIDAATPPVPALKASDLEREGLERLINNLRSRANAGHGGERSPTAELCAEAADVILALLSSRPAAPEDHTPRAVPLSTISEGWRPITDDPPKDGTPVDLWTCYAVKGTKRLYAERLADCRWAKDSQGEGWRDPGGNVIEWLTEDEEDGRAVRWVTHWHPITSPAPPAPSLSTEGEG